MMLTQSIFDEFILLMVTKDSEGLIVYMREIRAKCGDKTLVEYPELLADESRDLPKYFQCLADAMGKAWMSNGYEELWSEYQPNLQRHLDNWKNCPNAGDLEAVKSYVDKTFVIIDRIYLRMTFFYQSEF